MSSREEKKEIPKIHPEEWKSRLESIKTSKTDMNKLILNYLCLEGYRDAAKYFEKESGLTCDVGEAYAINERKEIRELIQKDCIDEAIDKLNDLCPEILEKNPGLNFKLQKQKLISLIKLKKTDEAINFAQTKLAPLAEANKNFLGEIEKVMTLLAFQEPQESKSAYLMEYSLRHSLASEVNEAILQAFCKTYEKKLVLLIKMMLHAQKKAIPLRVPQIKDLSSGKYDFE